MAAVGVARQHAAEEAQAERNQAAVQIDCAAARWTGRLSPSAQASCHAVSGARTVVWPRGQSRVFHRHRGCCSGRRRGEAGRSEERAATRRKRMRPHTRAAGRAAADACAPRVCGVSSARRGHARPASGGAAPGGCAYPKTEGWVRQCHDAFGAPRSPICKRTRLLTAQQQRRRGLKEARARERARGAAAVAAGRQGCAEAAQSTRTAQLPERRRAGSGAADVAARQCSAPAHERTPTGASVRSGGALQPGIQ